MKDNKIRPIKRIICWFMGHKHRESGDYSMCWRCGDIKKRVDCEQVS